MKRWISLLLGACLLAGCAGSGAPAAATAETAAAPTAAPQALTLACGNLGLTDTAGGRAVQNYTEANGVQLNYTYDYAAADLVVQPNAPTDGAEFRDLTADPLLKAAAARAGLDTTQPCYALPVGRSLYAYWANGDTLAALLGENAVADLQNCSWDEWQDFVETTTAWLAAPAATEVVLSGNAHTLPAEKPAAVANLPGVLYAFDRHYSMRTVYTPALLAAADTRTAEALTGPLNGVYAALTLEQENLGFANTETEDAFTAGVAAALQNGTTLFARMRLADLVTNLGAENCQSMVPIPVKCALDATDLTTTEYDLNGLLNHPVLAGSGYYAIPLTASEEGAKAAAAALLWLYTSADAEAMMTEDLALITPWGTASDSTALGAMQVNWVSTGILPEMALTDAECAALMELDVQGERKEFVQGVLAALGAAK